MPESYNLSVPVVLSFEQLDRLASSMKRDDPTKRWTDIERRKLARMRLMLVLKDYAEGRK